MANNDKWLTFPLQFSDEFNMPGRTFFEDDDPFFQAVDIWYGVTQDKEVSTNCVRKKTTAQTLTLPSGMTPTQ